MSWLPSPGPPAPMMEAMRIDGMIDMVNEVIPLTQGQQRAHLQKRRRQLKLRRREMTASETPPASQGGMADVTGNPHGRGNVIVDAANAVLLEYQEVALVEMQREGESTGQHLGLTLEGRINKTEDKSSVFYLTNADGAAALATEILAMGGRAGDPWQTDFMSAVNDRMDSLQQRGLDRPADA